MAERNEEKKIKVLLIDSEEEFCQYVKRVLEDTGRFELTIALDGVKGLELARQIQPDLLLTEIMLPGLTGEKVASLLHEDEATEGIPVIFLTSLIPEEDEGAIGDRFFIPKPIAPEKLLNDLDIFLREKNTGSQ